MGATAGLRWFIAGALAVPLCHQVALGALNAIGWIDRQPFGMAATRPFGVPSLISLSFWGGLWGIVLGLVLARRIGIAYWLVALVVGAGAPTLVAAFVAAPLKGQPLTFSMGFLAIGLLVNAAWGAGTAAIYRLLKGKTKEPRSRGAHVDS